MKFIAALCASSALLAGCGAGSGLGLDEGLVAPNDPAPADPAGRTISYRTASFTDPGLDISPDGERLYFSAMGEIYVVPIRGGLAEPLRLGAGWKERPVISPDGLNIAFLADRGAGITAWRAPLSGDRPAVGEAVPDYEATTLAWIDDASLGSTGGSTGNPVGFGLTIDYEGQHGSEHRSGQADRSRQVASASMSADRDGNVFLHRPAGVIRINAATGIEDVVVAPGDDPISQPRVTSDGAWLGFASMSAGTAHLKLKNLANGEMRDTGCKLNPWLGTVWNFAAGREPSYAFIPGQRAVVLERDGVFYRCTFEGVETPIAVEADVTIDVARRIRPTLVRENSASGMPFELASTADGRRVAFGGAGHVWIHDLSTGETSRISSTNVQERTPAFSPDGRRLAYVERLQDQSSNLKVLDLETGASTVMLHSRIALGNPGWSPDGRRIAFIEKPVAVNSEPTLRWLGLDGSTGVVGPIRATRGSDSFPHFTWDGSGSALLYMDQVISGQTLMSHGLAGEPHALFSVDPRVWDVRVSPSRRFVALRTRDAVYVTPILLASGVPPTFSWSDIRSMKRVWIGGADNVQWLADDSLIWTVQHKLMHAVPGESPRVISDLSFPLETQVEPERHAYVGATVISMDRTGTIDDAVIVTRGRTLEYVGLRAGAPDLTGIATTDLSGTWVVPGFIDVHAHDTFTERSEHNLPVSQYTLAELGFGVTTIFDPSAPSSTEITVQWAASQRDDFFGPTVYGTGVAIAGYPDSFRTMDVESYEHALVLASDLAGRGGLMFKDYHQRTRQQRQWLAQAASAFGLGVTADEDMTPAVILPLIVDGYTAIEHTIQHVGVLREDVKQFLIASQVTLTPTLLLQAGDLGLLGESSASDPRRACLVAPAEIVGRDSAALDPQRLLGSPAGLLVTDYADLLNRGARVTIGGHGDTPGLDFHWEMELLAVGGATPMNLLQAATLNGAEKLGLESRIGSLAQGKDADFLVLAANPLDDIRNARKIERVVRRGRVVTWPTGPAPQSWRSAAAWDDCQRWNFGLDRSDLPPPN